MNAEQLNEKLSQIQARIAISDLLDDAARCHKMSVARMQQAKELCDRAGQDWDKLKYGVPILFGQ